MPGYKANHGLNNGFFFNCTVVWLRPHDDLDLKHSSVGLCPIGLFGPSVFFLSFDCESKVIFLFLQSMFDLFPCDDTSNSKPPQELNNFVF